MLSNLTCPTCGEGVAMRGTQYDGPPIHDNETMHDQPCTNPCHPAAQRVVEAAVYRAQETYEYVRALLASLEKTEEER